MVKNKFLENHSKEECCGCEVCTLVCPKSIIEMYSDEEGFLYPRITDNSLCINCGLCNKVCPVSNPIKVEDSIIAFASGYVNSEIEVKQCASGGMATAISREFIQRMRGVVYGVKYSDNYENILFSRSENVEQLYAYKGSKYAQAQKDRIMVSVKQDLINGLNVLFIGLPCEVAALKNFTKNKFNNLYTIELVCHGPTSRKVHREYVKELCNKYGGRLTNFTVRYKYKGWKPYYVLAEFDNLIKHIEIFHQSEYGIAFRYMKRPSCSTCHFKLGDKQAGLQADITLGDFHYCHEGMEAYNKWGVSVAYIHTHKGEKLLDLGIIECKSFPTDARPALKSSFALKNAVQKKANRKEFSETFSSKGLSKACNLYSVRCIDNLMKSKSFVLRFVVRMRNLLYNCIGKRR